MKSSIKRYGVWGILAAFVLAGCGKVTQEVAAKDAEKVKSFSITFNIPVLVSDKAKEAIRKEDKMSPKLNWATIDDKSVYALIEGVKDNEGLERLAWGKAIVRRKVTMVKVRKKQSEIEDKELLAKLTKEAKEKKKKEEDAKKRASANGKAAEETGASTVSAASTGLATTVEPTFEVEEEQIVWSSKSSNRRGVTITKPNRDEVFIQLKKKTDEEYRWDASATKLRFGYKVYFAKIFVNKDHFYIYSFDETTAKKNNALSVDELSFYDSFVSTLYLMSMREAWYRLKSTIVLANIKQLFSETVFDTFDYTLPKNSKNLFRAKEPVFTVNRSLEKESLKIVNLVLKTDKREAKKYLEKSKVFNAKQQKAIAKSIDAFVSVQDKAPTAGTSNSSEASDASTPSDGTSTSTPEE